MFKTAAKNDQSRELRKVTESRENTGGVDDSAFINNEEMLLKSKKKSAEHRLGIVKAQMHRAMAHRQNTGNFVPRKTWSTWEAEKLRRLDEIHKIEEQLAAIRLHEKRFPPRSRIERLRGIEQAFVDVAKEMLAPPVFQRVMIAAYHRAGAKEEVIAELLSDNPASEKCQPL